ncbi:MAG TPA: GNAT family N-acetyltransferase [Longimicrobiales bacterium]|nr:GNAT family N-acetyltransferase [Longimicrobiales bacterium]
MEIRFARAEDTGDIAGLWCEAFPGRRTAADRARMLETGGRYGGLETVLVARDGNGRLAGACKIYRMTQHLAGAALPMMGLAAVAVAPYARRQGLGATLCGAALDEARARGDVLSTLYPFRPSYYERLGWGLVGRLLRHRFRTDSLPAYAEAGDVRPARFPADAEAIVACYGRVARRSNGPLARDRRIWAYRLAGEELGVRPLDEEAAFEGRTGRNRFAVFDRGGVAGYAILRHAPARSPADGVIHVRELIAETEGAYRGLLGHLAAQRDQWPLGLHFARPEERFGDRLEDPRPPRYRASRSLYFPTATRVHGPMLRVLDARGALAARPLFPGGEPDPRTLVLVVDDPQMPANAGPWRVVTTAGGSAAPEVVEPLPAAAPTPDARLETDAPTFARILAGEIAPTAANRLGRARIEEGRAGGAAGEVLDRAFATAEAFWLLDEF